MGWVCSSAIRTRTILAHQVIRQSQTDLLNTRKISPCSFNERIKTLRHFLVGRMRTTRSPTFLASWMNCAANTDWRLLPAPFPSPRSTKSGMPQATASSCTWLGHECGALRRRYRFSDPPMIQGNYWWLRVIKRRTVRVKLWKSQAAFGRADEHGWPFALTSPQGSPLMVVDPAATRAMGNVSLIENQLFIAKKRIKLAGVSFSNFRDTAPQKSRASTPN